MKSYLRHRSKRYGYDGWALKMPGATKVMEWTVCTTRAECRELRAERGDLLDRGADIVKVRISVEVINDV
jgi:hypothetical protein